MVALTLQHVSKDTPNLFLVFNEQNSFCTLGFAGLLFAGLFPGEPLVIPPSKRLEEGRCFRPKASVLPRRARPYTAGVTRFQGFGG